MQNVGMIDPDSCSTAKDWKKKCREIELSSWFCTVFLLVAAVASRSYTEPFSLSSHIGLVLQD